MNISGLPGISSLSRFGTSIVAVGANTVTATSSQADFDRVVLTDAFVKAVQLGDSLVELDHLVSTAQIRRARPAMAMSSALLGLSQDPLTATTMRSSEEINSTPTSFSPFGPDYIQPASSTAEPTLSGVYDGTNGTGTLTFEARSTGVHGVKNLRFWVDDPEGNQIDNFQVWSGDPIDQEYTLSNGLIFTLGAGDTAKNDTFTIELYDTVGSVVDPDKSLDGIRNDNPNLEYGLQVSDGTFDINGVTIAVNASDSINDVLARIDASAAGVSAVFDAATEQIALTRKSLGSSFDIILANDTSGFLQATKLDTAVAVPGTDGGVHTPIAELPLFDSVSSGTFRINDVDIALDVDVDSLEDVLARINASSAEASARMNNDRVLIEGKHRAAALKLDDVGTGFFAAVYISNGLHKPVASNGITQTSAEAIAAATVRVQTGLDSLFQNNARTPTALANFHSQVRSTMTAVAADLPEVSQLQPGLAIDTSALIESPWSGVAVDQMVASLQLDFREMRAILVGDAEDARAGFVRQLMGFVSQFTASTRGLVGTLGLQVDLYA